MSMISESKLIDVDPPPATPSGNRRPLSRVRAAGFGAVAGLAAGVAGGPIVLLAFAFAEVINGELAATPDWGLDLITFPFLALISTLYSVIIAGVPATLIGAALGAIVHRRPMNAPTLLSICLVGNVVTVVGAAMTLTGHESGFSLNELAFFFVISTIPTLVAAWVYVVLRRRHVNRLPNG